MDLSLRIYGIGIFTIRIYNPGFEIVSDVYAEKRQTDSRSGLIPPTVNNIPR
jgi:hypothetical protein